jgi:hypothetical protein
MKDEEAKDLVIEGLLSGWVCAVTAGEKIWAAVLAYRGISIPSSDEYHELLLEALATTGYAGVELSRATFSCDTKPSIQPAPRLQTASQ